ncbi:SH3 domain-binding protein 2 [Biomphalaria glabrata]|nr:SH3 domain-binding protein 2 [Biomphalaria glabrata]
MSRVHDTLSRVTTLPSQLMNLKSHSDISAQELIKLPKFAVKFGVLRKKPKLSIQNKWPRRFLVLLKDNIYIYKDETSNAPKNQLLLRCFNQVRRAESETHEWAFALVADNNLKSVGTKVFACLSEEERLGWMRAIKDQLCLAHGMPDSEVESCRRARSVSSNEFDFLEEVVSVGRDIQSDTYSSGSCGYYSSDESTSNASTNSLPSPPPDPTRHKRKPAVLPKPSKPQTAGGGGDKRSSNYINVEDVEGDDTYDMPVFEKLEVLCTVSDNSIGREELLRQLKATRAPGTYMLRKSRQNEDKVLSYLAQDDTVKEYKLHKFGGSFSLDKLKMFSTIEELLMYYTETYLPNSENTLKQGFYKET